MHPKSKTQKGVVRKVAKNHNIYEAYTNSEDMMQAHVDETY